MSDYVKELRKFVGNDPLLIPHSVAVVINKNNEVLFETRSDDGFLDFPGGAIEIGEDAVDAMKRELFEETNIVAKDATLFNVYSGPITYYKYKNGNEIYGIDLVYIVRDYEGNLVPEKSEVSQLNFISLDKIDTSKLSIRNKQIIKDLQNNYF